MPAGGQKKAFDVRDTGVRFHFNDTDLDFHFSTIVLGSTVSRGAEIGEAFYAASRIEVQRQQKICMDSFPNPLKKMVITPSDEGATNYCIMENRSIVGLVLFDWLDEVFRRW